VSSFYHFPNWISTQVGKDFSKSSSKAFHGWLVGTDEAKCDGTEDNVVDGDSESMPLGILLEIVLGIELGWLLFVNIREAEGAAVSGISGVKGFMVGIAVEVTGTLVGRKIGVGTATGEAIGATGTESNAFSHPQRIRKSSLSKR
jgi:hypothetical protein